MNANIHRVEQLIYANLVILGTVYFLVLIPQPDNQISKPSVLVTRP
jgi:hypothetical protein